MEEDKITYKLDILNVDGTPAQEKVIEKRGDIVRFTLAEMDAADRINKKNLKELQAKSGYEKAVMQNIEGNNKYGAEIKEMDNEKRYVIHMYQESFAMAKACDRKIEELEAAIKEHAEEVAEIGKQIPEVGGIPSPFMKSETVKVGTVDLPEINSNKDMLKPIELENGKWGVKEVDESGASLGMKEGEFGSEFEAQAFIDGDHEAKEEVAEVAEEAAEESAPEGEEAAETPADEAGESTPDTEATPE